MENKCGCPLDDQKGVVIRHRTRGCVCVKSLFSASVKMWSTRCLRGQGSAEEDHVGRLLEQLLLQCRGEKGLVIDGEAWFTPKGSCWLSVKQQL